MIDVVVRSAAFPDTENGLICFYNEKTSNKCVEPSIEYKSGKCTINNPDDMDKLAEMVKAMTREQFQSYRSRSGKSSWKDAYSTYLSEKVGIALQTEKGVVLEVNGVLVRFHCPVGEFVNWEKKTH